MYEIKERRVIPNWRDFKRTLQLGELNSYRVENKPVKLNIDRAIYDWQLNKNIGTAADLINSAIISGISDLDEVNNAIKYILLDKNKASVSLIDLVHFLEHKNGLRNEIIDNSLLETNKKNIEEFKSFLNDDVFYKLISRTKNISRIEIGNPIIWVELSRLYSMKGQNKKAEFAMTTALHLDPNNRFVLRSATRFFIHQKQYEKAIHYLKNSQILKDDPWLISAHIATSSIMGRFSPFINQGKALINSDNFSNFDLTELSSSIGTLEFKDGSYKKAKMFLNKSLLNPNDNSLAQIEWVSKHDKRFEVNLLGFNSVINPFEAYALDYFEKGEYLKAFENTIKWFLDMPFSKRPAILGSYISGSLLKNKEASIELCKLGLQANPDDSTLLNNIVYSIATSDDHTLLNKYFKKLSEIDFKDLPDENKITYQATFGLVAMRKGDIQTGVELYKAAIKNAKRINNDYLKNLAIVNFTRELINLNLNEKDNFIKILRKMNVQKNQKDLELVRNQVLDLINNSKTTS